MCAISRIGIGTANRCTTSQPGLSSTSPTSSAASWSIIGRQVSSAAIDEVVGKVAAEETAKLDVHRPS
jgi:hypothetical protein